MQFMAVHVGLATIIIPRNCIDAVFPGGFEKYKMQNERRFVDSFVWFDESIVVVDDSMGGAHHIDSVIEYWGDLGLDPEVHIGYASPFGTNCPWLIFDEESSMVMADENLPLFE